MDFHVCLDSDQAAAGEEFERIRLKPRHEYSYAGTSRPAKGTQSAEEPKDLGLLGVQGTNVLAYRLDSTQQIRGASVMQFRV